MSRESQRMWRVGKENQQTWLTKNRMLFVHSPLIIASHKLQFAIPSAAGGYFKDDFFKFRLRFGINRSRTEKQKNQNCNSIFKCIILVRFNSSSCVHKLFSYSNSDRHVHVKYNNSASEFIQSGRLADREKYFFLVSPLLSSYHPST